jgi:ABC-2 type transport system ATP-binding protein
MRRDSIMPAVELNKICKSYNDKVVVNNVSFTVEQGEIFGLIGPNGAGKTTTIRMMMDIVKPESGELSILGESLNGNTKNRIGYLPEERGLYRKMAVFQSLVYLASLKGIGNQAARTRAEELLQRVDMLPHQEKKIEELSRGMGQIIQFLTTIIHDPQLLILDEPFAGLDPVNTKLLKEIILELRSQGKAIILSTHIMNEVEALCDRILMINKGRPVLYGELDEIKSRYRNNSVFLKFDGALGEIEGVVRKKAHGDYVELFLDGETPPQKILQDLISRGVEINQFEVSTPSLNEIFLQVLEKGQ